MYINAQFNTSFSERKSLVSFFYWVAEKASAMTTKVIAVTFIAIIKWRRYYNLIGYE